MSQDTAIAVIGSDIGKTSFHVVGLDVHGAIVVRSRKRLLGGGIRPKKCFRVDIRYRLGNVQEPRNLVV
jgi:hypothetical protein